ncbi:MAG: lipocalin family protein [Paracoccaceae bacterium]|nr:lipocalin family protein [Paracoccaceae bacterium]
MHKLTRAAALATLLGVAACTAPGPHSSGPYRHPHAQIYSNASFQPARIGGDWREVAGFYDPAHATCALGLTHIAVRADGSLDLTLKSCGGWGGNQTVHATPTASGRYRLAMSGPRGEPWWVIWVDQEYQTMAIGTPSGAFGAIVARNGRVPADRIIAAKEVLDFNGYEVKRLIAAR